MRTGAGPAGILIDFDIEVGANAHCFTLKTKECEKLFSFYLNRDNTTTHIVSSKNDISNLNHPIHHHHPSSIGCDGDGTKTQKGWEYMCTKRQRSILFSSSAQYINLLHHLIVQHQGRVHSAASSLQNPKRINQKVSAVASAHTLCLEADRE
jgi:hypothetical protein